MKFNPDLAKRENKRVELEAKLEGQKPAENPAEQPMTEDYSHMFKPHNWLLLKGRQHGDYKYDDLLVSMHRLPLVPEVEHALRQLNYFELLEQRAGKTNNIQNRLDPTAEKDGPNYLGYLRHEEALCLASSLNCEIMCPRQGIDLRIDLDEALATNKTLLDGAGNPIPQEKLRKLHDEIWGVRGPWRAEWLDAIFTKRATDGKMLISYDHNYFNGRSKSYTEELLEAHLTTVGVMEITSANRHGLGTQAAHQGLYFIPPSHGTVARFGADSDGARFSCLGAPHNTSSALGMRLTRAKIPATGTGVSA